MLFVCLFVLTDLLRNMVNRNNLMFLIFLVFDYKSQYYNTQNNTYQINEGVRFSTRAILPFFPYRRKSNRSIHFNYRNTIVDF